MASIGRICRPRVFTLVALAIGMVLVTLAAFLKNAGMPKQAAHVFRMQQQPSGSRRVALYFDDVNSPSAHSSNVSSYLKCLDPEGKGLVQDTLCMKMPDFLPNYKNPCWVDWTEQLQRLRCLPYFHLLGVDKSGTTDLHSRIAEHPHVLLNSGGLGKETYYWCWMKYGQWMKRTMAPKTFYNYLRVFDTAAASIAGNPDPNGYHSLITGDGTPMDFWDFRAWPLIPQNKGLDEPVVLTPHLMRHMYVNPKFIVILRNPVDRLYSDYIFLGYGFTPEKFRTDVPRALAMMETCLRYKTTRQCVFSNHTYVTMPMRLHIGMYSVFMKEWLSVFPRGTFYILRTEDYTENMAKHLAQIYKFLDLAPLPEHTLDQIVQANRKHETKAKKNVADMYPETRELLTKFYSRYNEELAVLLEDTKYLWMPDEPV